MSSVAGWLSPSALPLSRMEKSLAVMRSELHERLHFGESGTQLHLLFECQQAEAVATAIKTKLSPPSQVADRTLASKPFVEINLLVSTDGAAMHSLSFEGLFDRLGIAELESAVVLSEQTTATAENTIPDNMGMSVYDGLALAACGDYGQFLKNTEIGKAIAEEGTRRGVPAGEVPSFVAWFLSILEETDNNWRKVLERTPTYLFSIALDARRERFEMIELRRNARLGLEPSPYQHLAYCQSADGIWMARTPSGVAAILQRDVAHDIRLVADMEPVRFVK